MQRNCGKRIDRFSQRGYGQYCSFQNAQLFVNRMQCPERILDLATLSRHSFLRGRTVRFHSTRVNLYTWRGQVNICFFEKSREFFVYPSIETPTLYMQNKIYIHTPRTISLLLPRHGKLQITNFWPSHQQIIVHIRLS